MDTTPWDGVADALDDLDFPADKDGIVRHATARGADEETVGLLRSLPLGTYRNISEIRSSVDLDPATDDGVSASRRAEQARSSHTRVAQHLRDP